jgi:predicted  nucleic acid-binding Zn-ribbon protein
MRSNRGAIFESDEESRLGNKPTMSFLAPLLEVQDLDVAADAARVRSARLPERETLPLLETKLSEIDSRLAGANAERAAAQAEEERVGQEVAQVARDIEAAEIDRYSGKRKNQDEAAAHNESQERLRERQTALEEQEMELLESVESVERRIEEEESARTSNLADSEKARDVIRKVEAEVSVELGRFSEAREKVSQRVPKNIFVAYERVRAQPQKTGRGAGTLADGRCGGCRIKLPSLEKTRMIAEPEDALIQCPQCRRVLVR